MWERGVGLPCVGIQTGCLRAMEAILINVEENALWRVQSREQRVAITSGRLSTSIFWPPDAKSWLIGKDPDAGEDWHQKGMIEDEMVGWHHRLNTHEFEQILGDGEGWKPNVNGAAKSWTWMNINKSFIYFSHQAQFLFLLCTLLIVLTAYFLSVY